MNASAANTWNGQTLDALGVRPLHENDLETIAGGISPVAAGLTLTFGFVGLVVAGVVAGVAVYYFSH